MEKLTKGQQKVYDFLVKTSKNDMPPTVREICEGTGFKSTSTVFVHLKSLEEKGYITRRSGLTRASVLKRDENLKDSVAVPIIGTVTAGQPIYAFEDIQGYINVDEDVKRGRELFALRVSGFSMINAGILDDDIVICVKQSVAENGEIVVALIEDEATVKRFYKENGYYRLQPENPDYEPILTDEVHILGKVIILNRNYEY